MNAGYSYSWLMLGCTELPVKYRNIVNVNLAITDYISSVDTSCFGMQHTLITVYKYNKVLQCNYSDVTTA